MDFSKILNLANDNKNRALEEARKKKIAMANKAKMKGNNVTSDAVKKFLERKNLEKRKQEAIEAQKRDELLSLRAAARNNRKASAMAKRTKDNNFIKMEDPIDESAPSAKIDIRMKTQENLRPTAKDISTRTNSVKKNTDNFRQNGREMPSKQNVTNPHKSRIQQQQERNTKALPLPTIDNHNNNRNTKLQSENKQGKINFPAKKPANAMDFNSLMKLAKTKQHEPIKVPEKKIDDARLMTQAEKRRFLEEQARKLGISVIIPGEESKISQNSKSNKPESSKKQMPATKPKPESQKLSKVQERSLPKNNQSKISNPPMSRNTLNGTTKLSSATQLIKDRTVSQYPLKSRDSKPTLPPNKPSPALVKPMERKQFPPRDLIPVNKPRSLNDTQAQRSRFNSVNHSKFASDSLARRGENMKRGPPIGRSEYIPTKRRLYDDDEEEDEEMSDFIDDGPAVAEDEDYSKHIREIFGYDKRRYAMIDDDDIIESSFARQMQEEKYSARIGVLEDLEEIRREQEELEKQYTSQKKRKR